MILQLWKRSGFLIVGLLFCLNVLAGESTHSNMIDAARLPIEAQTMLAIIRKGGPFSFSKDGAVFGNYEEVLPKQSRGYYHEYTVKIPGVHGRGARRIITGGNSILSHEYYYTDDHYVTFRRIKE